jgi:hypothetical protein
VPQFAIELGAVQDHFLRMDRIDGAERHGEVARILDVDHQLGPAAWRNLAHGAELLATIGNKSLEPNFDFFLHDVFSPASSTFPETSARVFAGTQ